MEQKEILAEKEAVKVVDDMKKRAKARFRYKVLEDLAISRIELERNLQPDRSARIRCYEAGGKSHCVIVSTEEDILKEISKHLKNQPNVEYLLVEWDKEEDELRDIRLALDIVFDSFDLDTAVDIAKNLLSRLEAKRKEVIGREVEKD